ncbi:hypothetical protein G7054_g14227 [Neopestalotiopsis clavispora]|nr:hypothetical protein G7054_g14227 [Neopestalotiopsis clavispora]
MASFDINNVRSQFPALQQDQVFFDNAGGSQTLGTVADSIYKYLTTNNVQLGASYRVGRLSTERYNDGFAAAAKFVNAKEDEIETDSLDSIWFRDDAAISQLVKLAAVPRGRRDHHLQHRPRGQHCALGRPGRAPEADAQVVDAGKVQQPEAPPGRPGGAPDPADPAGDVHAHEQHSRHHHRRGGRGQDGPRLPVSRGHGLRRRRGVRAAPPARPAGPRRRLLLLLVVQGLRPAHLAAVRVAAGAGLRGHAVPGPLFQKGRDPRGEARPRGRSYELLQSVPAVLAYLGPGTGSEAWESVRTREGELQQTLLDYLNGREDVTVLGEASADPAVRVPTVSFVVKGWNSQELVEKVEKDSNYAFRWGGFYSNRLVHELLGLGSDGVVRISMVHYNTVDEVKGIIKAIDRVISAC